MPEVAASPVEKTIEEIKEVEASEGAEEKKFEPKPRTAGTGNRRESRSQKIAREAEEKAAASGTPMKTQVIAPRAKASDEVRISSKGRVASYVAFASRLFIMGPPPPKTEEEREAEKAARLEEREKIKAMREAGEEVPEKPVVKKSEEYAKAPLDKITISGTGEALATCVLVSQVVQRRFKNVYTRS